MKIESIEINNEGYIFCKSSFYTAHTGLDHYTTYHFHTGINKLIGDIDSGNWAISYVLSMYKYEKNKIGNVMTLPLIATVNNEQVNLSELWEYTCYLSRIYPLFSSKKTVKKMITHAIRKNNLTTTANDVRELFHINKERFERPLSGVGNEIYRAMAAIGYVNAKEVFCFPWLSMRRFEGYHGHMPDLLEILENLNKIVIVPIGKE